MDETDNRAEQALAKYEQVVAAYHSVFDTPHGEIVLEHLAKVCHLFDMNTIGRDPYETYLREGERRVLLSILNVLKKDFSNIRKLMEEMQHG
jgi:hypothetical protein